MKTYRLCAIMTVAIGLLATMQCVFFSEADAAPLLENGSNASNQPSSTNNTEGKTTINAPKKNQ
jgi:hypothetical protein